MGWKREVVETNSQACDTLSEVDSRQSLVDVPSLHLREIRVMSPVE